MTVYTSTNLPWLVAAAALCPDSPLLPRGEVRLREQTHPDGTITFVYDGLTVGFTGRIPTGLGDYEMVWLTAAGSRREAYVRGAETAADRLRHEVMKELAR